MGFLSRAGLTGVRPEDVLGRPVPTLFYGRSAQASPTYRSGTGIGGRIDDRDVRGAGDGFAAAARDWPGRALSTDSR